MVIIKCKVCGGDIPLTEEKSFGSCEHCGSVMTLPKVRDEERAASYNQGNALRRAGGFDEALAVYQRIKAEDETDAEAHWCCALCRYGIEWEEDSSSLEYVPVCHRTENGSFLEDADYLAALEHSDGVTRRQYQKDAAKIADAQRDRAAGEEKGPKKTAKASSPGPKKRKSVPVIAAVLAFLLLGGAIFAWKLPSIRQEQAYQQAAGAFASGDYAAAAAAFTKLGGYKDSREKAAAARAQEQEAEAATVYEAARALLASGDYDGAIAAFTGLGDYKDSAAQAAAALTQKQEAEKASAYEAAEALLQSGDYDGALAAFAELETYLDSPEKLRETQALKAEAEKEAAYAKAGELLASGDYEAAYFAFAALEDYRDSGKKAEELLARYPKLLLYTAEAGDTILFGSYEQDNDQSNGSEAIEWLVLARADNRLLVISRYALDGRHFNQDHHMHWKDSPLRTWLNEEFYPAAFSEEEQARILTLSVGDTDVSVRETAAEGERDKVFLLNSTEAKKYFATSESRQCVPTAYAIARGVAQDQRYPVDGRPSCWWWLRPSGSESSIAVVVTGDGSFYSTGRGLMNETEGIRPVVWIDTAA